MTKAIFYVLGGFCVLVMGSLSYVGIALLMGIESACIPLPSELIMPYAGALSDAGVSAALLDTYKSVGLTSLPEFNLFLAALAGATQLARMMRMGQARVSQHQAGPGPSLPAARRDNHRPARDTRVPSLDGHRKGLRY